MRDYAALLLLTTAITVFTVALCCLAVWSKRELCDYVRFWRMRQELRRAWDARPQRVTNSHNVEDVRSNPFGRASQPRPRYPALLHLNIARDRDGKEIRH